MRYGNVLWTVHSQNMADFSAEFIRLKSENA